jgi:integrase
MYFAAAKSERMEQHLDPRLLHDVASILLDCGLRPEECFRLRPENVRDGRLRFNIGKMGILRRALSVLQFWANNYRLNPAIQRLLFPNWLAA